MPFEDCVYASAIGPDAILRIDRSYAYDCRRESVRTYDVTVTDSDNNMLFRVATLTQDIASDLGPMVPVWTDIATRRLWAWQMESDCNWISWPGLVDFKDIEDPDKVPFVIPDDHVSKLVYGSDHE